MLSRLLLVLLALIALPAAATAETLVVHAGRLITDAAQRPRGPSTITIVDGRITAIADGLQPAPAGARLIDQSRNTILPGLIDSHVHLSGDPAATSGARRSRPTNGGP